EQLTLQIGIQEKTTMKHKKTANTNKAWKNTEFPPSKIWAKLGRPTRVQDEAKTDNTTRWT
ncbi:1040_t:CDS:2, partial [Gigaspora margarita]